MVTALNKLKYGGRIMREFVYNILGIILFLGCLWFAFALGSVYEQDKRCANGYTVICYNKQ